MYVEQQLKGALQQAFQRLFAQEVPLQAILLQPTRKEFEGSHTFVTFPFAGSCQQHPEEIARQLGAWVKHHTHVVADFNVVKGFLNMVIADQVWLAQLAAMGREDRFGFLPRNGKKVVVEFSSPNTNKPLHLGHLRNNFLGDSIAEILKAAGYDVYKVSIINDRGMHICKSMVAYQQLGQGETPQTTGMKGDHLVGKYYVKFNQAYKAQVAALTQQLGNSMQAAQEAPILRAVQEMLQKWEQGDQATIALWKKMNSWVYQGFEATYQQLGITFDKNYYESDTYLLGKQIVAEGLAKGLFYKKKDGAVWVDLTAEGLDEKLLLRADGTAVYVTQDMGTADVRYEDYQFDKLIYVVGNEQDYHFKVLFKLLKQLGRSYVSGLYHLAYGMVDLPTGKMKSREGTVVDADHLLTAMLGTAEKHTKALGKIDNFSAKAAKNLYHMLAMGALKYFLLRVVAQKRLLFDPQASIDFQGDTGPFIQYTYARIASILRKAAQLGILVDQIVLQDTHALHPTERAVILQLYQFPQKLQEAAANYAPVVIALYVLELAKAYNRFYAAVSILYEQEAPLQSFRIYLSACVAKMIQKSMKLLGIEVPERM